MTINLTRLIFLCSLTIGIGTPYAQGQSSTFPGQVCEDPIEIGSVPFFDSGNTSIYLDDYVSEDRPPDAEGVLGTGLGWEGYLEGDDVVYAYQPTADDTIDISISHHHSWAGLFVFEGCPFDSTLAYHTEFTDPYDLDITNLVVTGGSTYYIVLSTSPTPQSTAYELAVRQAETTDCPAMGANVGSPCDDLNEQTIFDRITTECSCEGILPTAGWICENPLEFWELPYESTSDAEDYFDDYDYTNRPFNAYNAVAGPGSGDSLSSLPLNGFDVVYAYTAAESQSIDIILSDHETYDPYGYKMSLTAMTGCPFASTKGYYTQAFPPNDSLRPRIEGMPVVQGETYYIVVSGLDEQYPYLEPTEGLRTSYTLTVDLAKNSCPLLQAEVGDLCDDGNPATVNDRIKEGCICSGDSICNTPVPAATGLIVSAVGGNGVLATWNPVPGSIGCEHILQTTEGLLIKRYVQQAYEASEIHAPANLFDYQTGYIWAMRCGCSVDPLLIGPWSTKAFVLVGGITLESSPNPVSGTSHVKFAASGVENATLEVYDLNGRKHSTLHTGSLESDRTYYMDFDTSNLSPGVYLYRLTTTTGVRNEKFIVSK